MARRYFGTDGVRGIVGELLTPSSSRLGKAVALWSGRGRVFVRPRHARASGAELEEALARGIASAGGNAVLAGVLPTPAVALLALDLGAVITASHNPPEYNGVKFFDRDGQKLTDASEEEIEALLDAPAPRRREVDRVEVADRQLPRARARALRLRPQRACASRSTVRTAPTPSSRRARSSSSARRSTAIGDEPDGTNINDGLRRDRSPRAAENRDARTASTSASRSTATATGCSPSTTNGRRRRRRPDPRDPRARTSASTSSQSPSMTNLGLHQLMEEHGIRVVTTDVGDRYVLEALRREGGLLGGEQSGPHHLSATTTSRATALPRRCFSATRSRGPHARRGGGRRCRRFPQVKREPRRSRFAPAKRSSTRSKRLNRALERQRRACSCARPARSPSSGVLAEAETEAEARETLC